MRRSIVAVTFTALVAGCGLFRHGISTTPDYSARSTAVWGDWVLANPDSTSFVGAQRVELSLQPGTFTIRALYPGASGATSVSGTAEMTSTGVLTLVPQSSLTTPSGRGTNLIAGQPVVLIASAAGGTMVFAPSTRSDPTPSSVWHRSDAAAAAGITGATASTTPPR